MNAIPGTPPDTSATAQAAPESSQPAPRATPRVPRRRKKAHRLTRREALEAAARFQQDAHGKLLILRFNLTQRVEHMLLIISFSTLALTGLPQRYSTSTLGSLMLRMLGGIETARQIHHIFAVLFILEAAFHVGYFLFGLFIYRRAGSMWPTLDDFRHFIGMIRYNLGLSKERPRFGRYTFEEKAEYWALVWGGVLMILTGLMQWFPTQTTRFLPGVAIPVARAIHGWEAVLAVLAILTWHTYHTVIKHFNKSIFTGTMTLEEMLEEHPAELEYLKKAVAALERAGIAPENLPDLHQLEQGDGDSESQVGGSAR